MDPVKVSYSQLSTLRDCPLKFAWHYLEGWRGTDPNRNLDLGSVWHQHVLEPHYNLIKAAQDDTANGRSPLRGTPKERILLAKAKADVQDSLDTALASDGFPGITPADYDILRWMYDGYTETFGCDSRWKILDVEYKGLVPLGTITTPDGPRDVVLDFRIDLVVEDLDMHGVFAIEHKTAAQLPTLFALELDDQTGLYEWAFRRSGHEYADTINGCVRSVAKKTMNVGDMPGATKGKAQSLAQRFQRKPVPRTDIELDAIARDALAASQAAYGGNLPIYSAPNPQQCGWKCGFNQVHVLARKGLPVPTLMKDYGFQQIPTAWNGK